MYSIYRPGEGLVGGVEGLYPAIGAVVESAAGQHSVVRVHITYSICMLYKCNQYTCI